MMRKLVALAFAAICIALVNADENYGEGTDKHRILKAMMAGETSTFQATLYLEGSSGKKEVRRFVLPKNASTDFLLLEKKLKTVFQSLQSLPFSVAWEVSEGEEVLISSDEELIIAINEMKGEVYRLKIEVKSASGLKDENAEARMAEETYSFKATWYLEGSSGKKEVRRFHLPKNTSTDFHLLEKKLKTVFQLLQSLPFSVTWEDSEGEEVLISSDEELKTAINEMKGEVYRLKIEVKSASARMMEETSTFQATLYLEGSSGKKEVRRFVLPKNASTDFLFLEKKLKTVFQSLQSLPFSVAWEASEGEEVLISSDEELKIAINEMNGEVYRLKIEVKSASGLKDENAEARMAEETSAFKATLYLEDSSEKNEVRRFVLPKNASTDFHLLEEKLNTVFQSLQSLPFSVSWEDSEGDKVLISSDKEMKIALKEMKGEVYRLKIEVKSASGLKNENAEVNKTEEEVVLARKEVVEEESYHRNTQPLQFHERTGDNIVLSNNKRTAARKSYEAIYNGGSVITNRPLKDNELFEVQLDTIIDKWGNLFSLGVTVANPTTVSFKGHWTSFNNGVWIYYYHRISHNGKDIQYGYGIDLSSLKVGDRVGVMRKSNGFLHFFVNGADQGAIKTTVPETVYGVMDLFGDAVQATIVKP